MTDIVRFGKERRNFPRARGLLSVEIDKVPSARTIDFNENGMCVVTEKPILPSAPLVVSILEIPIHADARVVWSKPSEEGFQAGLQFLGLSSQESDSIRKLLLEAFSKRAVGDSEDSSVKETVSAFFLKDVADYLRELAGIMAGISNPASSGDQLYARFQRATDTITARCGELNRQVDFRIVRERTKESFREIVGPWIYKSEIVKRAFDKPRGYPGDARLIELIYDNKVISNHFGAHSERYFLENEYAVAVRNRKTRMGELLKQLIRESKNDQINVMNLGCGSCREISEILSSIKTTGKTVRFTCVDQDEEALDFSSKRLHNGATNVEFDFVKEDVLTLSRNRGAIPKESFDVVYSIGLADYFPDRVLKKLVAFLLESLKIHGTCVIAHKDIDQYKPLSPEWFCDWSFYPRNEEKLEQMINEAATSSGIPVQVSFEREPSQRVMFAKASRSNGGL